MNDNPQADDRHNGHDRPAEPEEALGDALRRAVGARVAALPVGPAPGPDVISDLAAARARRRTATRVGLAAAAAVALVAAVVGWTLVADDEPGSVVVVAEPEGEQAEDEAASSDAGSDTAGAADSAPSAAAPSGGSSDGAATGEDPRPAGADDGRAADAVDAPEPPLVTPEELSTGPVLRWSEVGPDFWDLWGLQSLGDGRVLAHASRNVAELPQIDTREVTVITSDGINWTEVNLPAEVYAHHVAVSGDRWIVAGPDRSSPSVFDRSGRVFVSNDATATWTELDIDVPPDTAPASPWIEHHRALVSALVSGDDIVVALGVGPYLDVEGLVETRGLLPEGSSAVGWSYYGESEGTVSVMVGDSAALEQFTPAAVEEGDYGADYGSDFPMGETQQFTFEELGLTAEEQDALLGEPRSLLLLWSDGETVGEPVEVTSTREVFGAQGAVTDDGFVIHLVGMSQGSILTSPDGRTWTEHPHDTWLFGAVVYRNAVWAAVVEPSGTSLKRAAFGSEPQTVAGFEGLRVAQLHAGPAGLVADAMLEFPSGIYGDSPNGDDFYAAMPEVSISRDGYELRYNDPPAGVTLWDVAAGEAVRVFEAEELNSDEPIAGVREDADESGMWVSFTDPDTGEDLVTFTPEDFEAVFDAMWVEGIPEPGTAQSLAAESGYSSQDNWVGWSADGTSWGWQTMTEAFGVGADEAWVEYGIGRDFVVAAVQPFGTPPVPARDGSDALVAMPEEVRVFIAAAS